MIPANQSRHRTEAGQVQIPNTVNPTAFSYQSFHNENSIRLLKIEPAGCCDDMLVCTLSVAEFGDKPQFEALSYTWGTSPDERLIMLNGHRFSIGENLRDALVFLRNQHRQLPLWVDAICINQKDLPERNSQLRIMHHIYMRAKTVVVWLGKDLQVDQDLFDSFQSQQVQSSIDSHGEIQNPVQSPAWTRPMAVNVARQEEVAKEICRNAYWKRLWIIQEIAHAFRLVVCFGRATCLTWESFKDFIVKYGVDQGGPVRLHRLRNEVAAGSCTLQTLLIDHRGAICAEPRDKVYGLKGLAADADDLPMDYRKSLMEVWMDVMEFVNKKKTPSETDIMSFGALVKHLLMSDDSTPLRSALRPQGATVNSSMHIGVSKNPKAFHIDGFVIGKIQFVGPSTDDIVANVRSVDTWRRKVQEHFPIDIQSATRESNELLHALLQFPQSQTCFNHVSPMQWQIRSRNCSVDSVNHQTGEMRCDLAYEYLQSTGNPTRTDRDYVREGPRLFQLRSRNRRITWRMGIASSQAEQGDLVVWVSGIRQAIVVRIHKNGMSKQGHAHLQVYGSAWMTEDVAKSKGGHEERLRSFEPEDSLSLQMDATTIFILVAQNDVSCVAPLRRENP